jgi:hypothetical protein
MSLPFPSSARAFLYLNDSTPCGIGFSGNKSQDSVAFQSIREFGGAMVAVLRNIGEWSRCKSYLRNEGEKEITG